MKYAIILGIVGAVAAAAFPWLRRGEKAPPDLQQKPPPHVEVAHPQKKTIHRKLRLPGDVRANQEVAIYARVPGYVGVIGADRGDWVEAGHELARLEAPEMEKQLAKEKAERDWRKATWERLDRISKKTPNLINQDLLDDAKGRYDVAAAEVEKTETLLKLGILRAPFPGVISERWVDTGTLVQPGSTKLFHLIQGDVVRVRIHIPQADVPTVREKCLADVRIDELPGVKFDRLPIARMFWALNRDTKTMAVELDLKNAGDDRSLWARPGMFARVTIDLDARKDVLVLPAASLVVEKKKTFVFVIRDGVARKTAVEIGLDNGIEFEVKSGATEADDVVIGGKNLISDGDPVRVTRK